MSNSIRDEIDTPECEAMMKELRERGRQPRPSISAERVWRIAQKYEGYYDAARYNKAIKEALREAGVEVRSEHAD